MASQIPADIGQSALGNGPVLGKAGLDGLMPMHVWVGSSGHILHVGPTLAKLCPERPLNGLRLFELFAFRRPRGVQLIADLTAAGNSHIRAALRGRERLSLRGIVVPLPSGQGVLLNLSLGISVAEAVRKFSLKATDFAPSDPTVEMLYLIEAQTAVLNESRKLNSRLQGARVAAEEQAYTDTLTGLKNRRALDHVMGRLSGATTPRRFGLMHVDLDYFKSVNDSFGHAAGDHVLQQAARIFVEETRSDDLVARTGGDEFVLVLMDCDDEDKLKGIAARIIERLEKPIHFDGATCRISASIGITVSTYYNTISAEKLSSDADSALYQSKNRGRACHTLFSKENLSRCNGGALP